MEGEPKMERIELLSTACRLIKEQDEEQAVEDAVLIDMLKAAYDIGRKDGMKKDERFLLQK